jgi:hypothetical protein
MPDRITSRDTALERLRRLTQADSAPTLDNDDLLTLLEGSAVATLWVAATVYAVGDVVQPNTANGYRYVCVTAGTSAATEPDWPDGRESRITDGSTLVWEEAGAEYSSLWDLQMAAYNGWLLKGSKTVENIDFARGQQNFKNSQVYEHCLTQADRFRPVGVS